MSTTSPATQAAQLLSISTALLGAGSIGTLSLFDVPLLQSQPASRSLPSIRWLFSRGSHIFPQAAAVSSAAFAYLAYDALPLDNRSLLALLRGIDDGGKISCYVAAAALTISIAPFTTFVMLPTNFELIQKNEDSGGARSEASASSGATGGRSAEESVAGKNDVDELRDLSKPQEKSSKETTEKEDREVKRLLERFGALNGVRAVLMGLGGVVGLLGSLST